MVVLFMLCTLPAVSACQPGDAPGAPTVSPAATGSAATAVISTPAAVPAASTPAATPGAGQAPTTAATAGPLPIEVVFGTGPFALPETTAGLAGLSSYKAALTLSFDGTQDGATRRWSKTYVMLAAREPAARLVTIEKTGDLSDLVPVFMAEVDGAAYERLGKTTCTATVLDQSNSLAERLEPAGFLTGVIGADAAGSETVNGVAANHYTFDERALGQLGLTKSKGELWVSAVGGFIVRYKVAARANAVYFGAGIKGTLTWDYELTGAGQPVAIQLLTECPAGLVNAPLLPDATAVRRLPGLLSFSTASGVANAAAFYQKQIPLLGWKPVGTPFISDTLGLLDYAQGAKTMKLVITGTGGTTVQIMVGSQP